jgi:hypothetical protein
VVFESGPLSLALLDGTSHAEPLLVNKGRSVSNHYCQAVLPPQGSTVELQVEDERHMVATSAPFIVATDLKGTHSW